MALTFVGSSALFSVYDFHDSTDIFVEYYIIEILVICEGCNYVNSVNVNYVIHNFWVQLAWYDNVIIYYENFLVISWGIITLFSD